MEAPDLETGWKDLTAMERMSLMEDYGDGWMDFLCGADFWCFNTTKVLSF